jgi:thiol-disulfide isomerase/thioredoxin
MKHTLFLIIITLFLSGCKNDKQSLSESPAEVTETEEFTVQDPLSDTNLVDNIKLFDLEGNPIDLKEYAGKKIFLNFWATWCKPCIVEMPSIERAQQLLADDGYMFFLASDETVGRINRFKATQDFNLNFIRVETQFPDIGILSLPTTMIIDEKGIIAMNQIGALEWDSPEIIEKLRGVNF